MRTRRDILIVASLSVCCLLSCSEKTDIAREAAIVPFVSIEDNAVSVKSEVIGTTFPENGTYGIFVCKPDHTFSKFDEYVDRSNNIQAQYIVPSQGLEGQWYYKYNGYGSWFTTLFFKSSETNKYASVYGYSPFVNNLKNLREIPFESKNQDDLMFARQNKDTDANKNINMYDGSADEHKVYFRFVHALSLIELSLKLNFDKSNVILDSYYVTTTSNGDTKLCSKGTFDAITGEITPDEESEPVISRPVTGDYSRKQNVFSERRRSFYILVPPVDVKGDDLVVGLVIDGVGGDGSGVNSIVVSRESLKHSDETYGLKAGYKYTLNIDIDNYLHLTGVSIDDTWTETEYNKDI